MSINQIEKDLDQQFNDKLMAAVRHISMMYDVAGIDHSRATPTVAAACLRMACWLCASGGVSRKTFLEVCGGIFDSARNFQASKQDGV